MCAVSESSSLRSYSWVNSGLQSQTLWGLLILLPDPPAELPDMGLRTFTAEGEFLWYSSSPVCELPT